MTDFAKDVQSYLKDEGLVDGTTSWQSTVGDWRDQPDQLVVINEDATRDPEFPADEGLGSGALFWPAVHVLVRGKAADRASARAKADAIFALLHGVQGVVVGDTTVLSLRARGSFAQVYDDKRRPMLTRSYVATVSAR